MARNSAKKIFDIIPASADSVESEEINLREQGESTPQASVEVNNKPQEISSSGLDELVSKIIDVLPEENAREELAMVLDRVDEPVVELARMGAVVRKNNELGIMNNGARSTNHKSQIKNESTNKSQRIEEGELYEKALSHIRAPENNYVIQLASAKAKSPIKEEYIIGGPELLPERQAMVVDFYNKQPIIAQPIKTDFKIPVIEKKALNFAPQKKKNFSAHFFVFLGVIGIISYGLTLKNELVNESSSAVNSLEQARKSFESFDFSGASDNFEKSYADFSKASQNLNLMGASLAGIFSDLPGFDELTAGGFGKLKSAKDIVEAGKLLAKSGQEMSEALSAISQTGGILNPKDDHKVKPSQIISRLKNALELSSINFDKAKALIANVDPSIIPEGQRADFIDFKDKLPLLEKVIASAVSYTDFLEGIIGIDQPKKYLILFNNYSELRPIGGFPGTYGVVSFAGGGLQDFFVNDVYNLDGQLKRNIVPPKQLQHITPTWGMRDSAWFIDFPSSAKKTMSFFREEAGYPVDGVITVNPDVISDILKVVGPIKMPDYDRILTADNFLASIQEEVEYGENRIQPKTVVVDFAPRLLEKLYSASSESWLKIFTALMERVDEGDIIFYFNDKELEDFTIKEGFGGEVKKTDGDYLAVNFSNVKGSKTDIVTDSSISIDSRFEGGKIIHKVTVIRQHNGGDHDHGFYNKQNPAYVRVLVPKNAEVLNVEGNDLPNFKPLVSYGLGFEKDRDLAQFEAGFYFDKALGADRFEESGRQGIGFWMITDPKTSKKIEFEYAVPVDSREYNFYFQKQPGLDWKNFKLKLDNLDKKEITNISPEFNVVGNSYILDQELTKDIEVNVKFK